jgi:hypothetical protein
MARNLEGIREEVYTPCKPMQKINVMPKDKWVKLHNGHLKRGQIFCVKPVPHPAENVDEITCPCGKSIIVMKEERDALD